MQTTICRWGLVLLLAILTGPLGAQEAGQPPLEGIEISPDEQSIVLPVSTTRRYTFPPPYAIVPTPYVERTDTITVRVVQPEMEGRLPNSFELTATDRTGATTLVMPLFNTETKERVVQRMEILIVDEVTEAYQLYLNAQLRKLFPNSNISVLVANTRTAILHGYVDQPEIADPILQMVRGFLAQRSGVAPGEVTVVNSMRVTGAMQVQLKVVIAEVNRTKLRDLGFDWSWMDLGPGPLVSSLRQSAGGLFMPAGTQIVLNPAGGIAVVPTVEAATGDSTLPFNVLRANQFSFNGYVRALQGHGFGKILAEPVVVTVSGRPVFFNAGGEVPLITTGSLGAVNITYRPFGTNVRCVPTVLGDGRIRLEVRPEISEVSGETTIGTTSVPQFTSRTVETTVEVESGQTFAIAGLVQERLIANKTQIPFMSSLPLVGWAFQTKSYSQSNTDLVILVTPHLVDGLDQRPCKLPGRESRIPDDLEWYIGGRMEPPCFPDPYAHHWHRHFHGESKPEAPVPVAPYDNYGQPGPTVIVPQPVPGGQESPSPSPVPELKKVPAPAAKPEAKPAAKPDGNAGGVARPESAKGVTLAPFEGRMPKWPDDYLGVPMVPRSPNGQAREPVVMPVSASTSAMPAGAPVGEALLPRTAGPPAPTSMPAPMPKDADVVPLPGPIEDLDAGPLVPIPTPFDDSASDAGPGPMAPGRSGTGETPVPPSAAPASKPAAASKKSKPQELRWQTKW